MPLYHNSIDPNLLVHKGVSRGRWAWSPSMFDVAETTPLDNLVAVQLAAKKLCNRKLPGAAMGAISKLLSAGRPVATLMTRVHELDPRNDARLPRTLEEVLNEAIDRKSGGQGKRVADGVESGGR